MKTKLTLSAKKDRPSDVSPEILIFLNNEFIDESVILSGDEFVLENDFIFQEGWNEINYVVNDMSWSEDDGKLWDLLVTQLEIDGSTIMPISRGEGLVPFRLEFNPADIVVEIENYENGSLDATQYQQMAGKPINTDCSFGFCFKIENDKVVDFYFLGQDKIIANDVLNIHTGTFLKLVRMAVRNQTGNTNLDEFLLLGNGSTASEIWGIPILLKPIELDQVQVLIQQRPWTRTKFFSQYQDGKLPAEKLKLILTVPTTD